MTLSYLVSTAGHAQEQNERNPHDIQSILQLIIDGAEEFKDEKVVGFTNYTDGQWVCDRYSFRELCQLSDERAKGLQDRGVNVLQDEEGIVSMLCPTGLDFLITWIALMRMGYGVVLVAPQCSPSAISHLVSSTGSSRLIYHPKYVELAQAASSLNPNIPLVEIPLTRASRTTSSTLPWTVKNTHAPSHIFHTSGTSGTPKPIPHTHFHSTSVLPRRRLPSYLTSPSSSTTSSSPESSSSPKSSSSSLPSSESAAFTTTPLFHGGVSDLLRGWLARSVVYFYPTSDMPITSAHVTSAVGACNTPAQPLKGTDLNSDQEKEREDRFRVTSFLSVPYILSVLAEDEGGMKMLKQMDLVSTGGAPLDSKTGDEMVSKGVKLVSRLGSSECGFLMSSYRDFEKENDWEWLRNDSAYGNALRFEPVSENRYEMVVTDKWASKTKTNRPDGSYATGDLYMPHETKPNVWKYAGRGDDVIVMSNGEKASPGPIETILRRSPCLLDALVVGADKDQLGLLLFSKPNAPENLIEAISPLLDEANAASPSYAQISKEMCVDINVDGQTRQLPKSSKGTVQRGMAYTEFEEDINRLYAGNSIDGEQVKRSIEEIEEVVRDIIVDVAKGKCKVDKLDTETDLFSWGVDSLMATRIRGGLKKRLNTGGKGLPNNVVFEKPSISSLAEYVFALQEGSETTSIVDPHDLVRKLVEKYGSFESVENAASKIANGHSNSDGGAARGKTILLTGATGSLGSFILAQLAALPKEVVDRIICLVRADNDESAAQRVEKALSQRDLQASQGRYVVNAAELSIDRLGLSEVTYEEVRQSDVVIHAAWPVHFASSLISFEDSIKGTKNLIDLVRSSSNNQSKFFFCSSLASVLNSPESVIKEEPTEDPRTSSPIGYSQSKWVTENICMKAVKEGQMDGRIGILRIGQLCGDTISGRWNEKEGWPLMFLTGLDTGVLPVLNESPSWLPVDLAASAVIDIALRDEISHPVYHVAHPKTIEWSTILNGLTKAGLPFDAVEPGMWLEKVNKLKDDHPSKGMVPLWQAAYGSGKMNDDVLVDTARAVSVSPTLKDIRLVDEDLIGKMVNAWRKSGFLRF